MTIKEFLDSKPSLTQILEYVEEQAQQIARERKMAAGQEAQGIKMGFGR
ncbi:MAG TPA: hypothetical protein VN368_00220 [Candidatus Methylomirabilis sp.]|nr:hypothetical protein [Candidatus Methylomirabilis sp.]